MTDNIKTLKPATVLPDPNVIAVAEEAMRLAKSGELRNIAVAGSCMGSEYYHNSVCDSRIELVGLLEAVKHGLLFSAAIREREL